jgi:hypothetical protein
MIRVRIKLAAQFSLLACCVIAFTPASIRADLTPKQARRAITRMSGFKLNNGSVRVRTISVTNAAAAEVSVEIKTVLKFVQDEQARWHVAEIRTGQDRWEEIDLIADALNSQVPVAECNAPEPPFRGPLAIDPSMRRARCLLGNLLGVELPSDALRIQEVDPMPIALASQASATVVAWVRVDARFVNDKNGWRVSELRTGNRDWVKLEPLVTAVNERKQKKARAELEMMARALEKFRKDRGFFVVSDSHAVAVDYLSPRYLPRVIRVDPWHKSYKYQGERDHFTMRSAGPDGKENTPDDIQIQSR